MTTDLPQPAADLRRVFEEQAVQATVWTSVLLHARMVGNFDEAARAQRELESLGVSVQFRRGPARARTRGCARQEEASDA